MADIIDLTTAQTLGGWSPVREAWAYASATTFTITGDYTNKYTVGDRIRLTQEGSVKYFAVVARSYAAPNTTITITGGTAYTFTDTDISDTYHSKYGTPTGYPSNFAYSPTLTASTTNPTLGNSTLTGYFSVGTNRQVDISVNLTIGSSFSAGSGTYRISLPLTAGTVGDLEFYCHGLIHDIGFARIPIIGRIAGGETVIRDIWDSTPSAITNSTPITWATGDQILLTAQYLI